MVFNISIASYTTVNNNPAGENAYNSVNEDRIVLLIEWVILEELSTFPFVQV